MSQRSETPDFPPEPPEPLLPLDDQEKADIDRARAWIHEKWEKPGHSKCPICGTDDWQIGGPVGLPAYRRTLGTAVIPVFTVTCGNCGTTLLLNALYPAYLLADPSEDTEETSP